MTKPCKLAVLLSGSGTTLQNIFDNIDQGNLPGVSVDLVVSSKVGVKGLQRAEDRGVENIVVESRTFRDSETKKTDWDAMSKSIVERIIDADIDLVILAGYMCMFIVPEALESRVMNVHPALIPAFSGQGMYGEKVHQAVVKRGVKLTGCTVHFVTNEYDAGPIILQRICNVDSEDTAETVQSKVQALERQAYPEAIALYAAGRLSVSGGVVSVRPKE